MSEYFDDQNVPGIPEEMPQPTPPEENAKKPKKVKKKHLLWIIPVAAILVITILGALLWQPILLSVSPNLYTSIVLNNTLSSLGKRGDSGIGQLVSDFGQTLADGQIDLEIKGYDEHNGRHKQLQVSLKSQLEDRKAMLSYSFKDTVPLTDLQATIYVDQDRLVVGSALANNGAFYGFTYDDFAENLKQSGYGQYLSDEQIALYDSYVHRLEDTLSKDKGIDEIFKPYAQILTDYIESLTPVQSDETIVLDGEDTKTKALRYELSHRELSALFRQLLDRMENDEALRNLALSNSGLSEEAQLQQEWMQVIEQLRASIPVGSEATDSAVTFYVYRSAVVRVDFGSVDEDASLTICFGKNPSKSDIIISSVAETFGIKVNSKVTISNTEEKKLSNYRIVSESSIGDFVTKTETFLEWNRSENTLTYEATQEGDQTQFVFNIEEHKNGYTLTYEDYRPYNDEYSIDFVLRLTEGASVQPPAYTNLKDMSIELIDSLLAGVGLQDSSIGMGTKVADQALILSEADRAALESQCRDIVRRYNVEMAVFTEDKIIADTLTAEAFSLYRSSGFGLEGHDLGYMIFVEEASAEAVLVQIGGPLGKDQISKITADMQSAINAEQNIYEVISLGLTELSDTLKNI